MKVKVDWCKDDVDVALPEIVDVPDYIDEDEVCDYLSDKYGFLINGIEYVVPPFYKSIKVGDKVKWFDPAWTDCNSREESVEHLNMVRTVTDIRREESEDNEELCSGDIVELDNGTEVWARECVAPGTIFSLSGSKLIITEQ